MLAEGAEAGTLVLSGGERETGHCGLGGVGVWVCRPAGRREGYIGVMEAMEDNGELDERGPHNARTHIDRRESVRIRTVGRKRSVLIAIIMLESGRKYEADYFGDGDEQSSSLSSTTSSGRDRPRRRVGL